jgi:tetratricopeptide (TPR) repeat protein
MLAARLGEERLAAEAGATIELIGLCARLPLALSIVTARALGRTGSTIATLAAELREARSRLDQLDTGDASTSVRAVFSWSYQTLSNPAARMFRLLGACPGPDISMPAAAALAGEPTDRVSLMLLELTGTQLVAPHAEGRFAFHDLLRSYAMERSAAQEVSADRDAAIRRLLYWYLHTATAAARTVNPRRRHVSVDTAPHGVAPLAFSSYDEGLAWLDAEHANLVAAVELAAVQGEHEIAWKLPLSMWDLFSLRGLFDDWIAAHQTGLASAEQIDERVGQAWILNNLGGAYMLQDRDGEALACYERVLPLLPDLRNTHSEASILHNLGLMQMRLDQHAVALDTLGTALAAYSNLGDLDGEGHTLNTIGETLRLLGRFDEALSCYEQAVRNFRETGNRFGESLAITDEGQALLELGDHGRAIERADRAAALSREIGHLPGEAHARQILGHALRGSGRPDEARENWMLTAKIYEDLGDSRAAKIRALL